MRQDLIGKEDFIFQTGKQIWWEEECSLSKPHYGLVNATMNGIGLFKSNLQIQFKEKLSFFFVNFPKFVSSAACSVKFCIRK